MTDDELRAGPFAFSDNGLFEGADGWLVDTVLSESLTPGGHTFTFDRPYADAILTALEPFPKLFRCKENDTKDEPHGRGDLRLYPLSDRAAWGALVDTEKPDENYPLARIIMDAKPGQAVGMLDTSEPGRRDYRRANLRPVKRSSKTPTRTEFLRGIHWRVAHLQGDDAADRHDEKVRRLFSEADALTGAPGTTCIIVDHKEKATDQ